MTEGNGSFRISKCQNRGTAEQTNKEPQLGAKRKVIYEANNDRREWFMSKCQNMGTAEQMNKGFRMMKCQNGRPEQYFFN